MAGYSLVRPPRPWFRRIRCSPALISWSLPWPFGRHDRRSCACGSSSSWSRGRSARSRRRLAWLAWPVARPQKSRAN